ncbi:hypothetical protein LLG95_00605 [bacterium]|nr:hypothetical protein [bacterium]
MYDLQVENIREISDQYTILKCQVERQLGMDPGRCVTIGVTSCERGEGVSSVVLNLAMAFSQNPDNRVLVVDAKPNNIARTPMMKRLWKARNKPEAEPTDTTAVERSTENGSKLIRAEGNFDIILVQGKSNGARGYFKVEAFRLFLDKAREQYNLILVDAPAIKENSFTPLIASSLEGLLLVIEAGRVRRAVIERAAKDLRKMGGNLLGVVLNKQRFPIPGFIYRWI